MSGKTEVSRDLVDFARRCHPACFACRDRALGGLGLRFESLEDGSVAADFACDQEYQSYPDRLHGGVVALLLDAAMTHCLFAMGLHGVTARMSLRFHSSAEIGARATIRAHLVRTAHNMYILEAEMLQGDVVRASAEARFLCHPEQKKWAGSLLSRAGMKSISR